MAENTNLFSNFSGSYTPPETIKREEDEEKTDLFSEFSGSYISSEPAIQEEPEVPVGETPESNTFDFMSGLVGDVQPRAPLVTGTPSPAVPDADARIFPYTPDVFSDNKKLRRAQRANRKAFKEELDEAYERGEEIEGMQEAKRLQYTLADAFRGVSNSASLAFEQAGLIEQGTTQKLIDDYEEFGGDRRIEEMINFSTKAGEKGSNKFTRATRATYAMLDYLVSNPMAGVNFLASQVPAMLTAIGPGKVAKMGTGALLKSIGAARKIPKISRLLKEASFGASFNSTMVMFQSLGANYEAGLQKFNGNDEEAKAYAIKKTTAELGPNAIAGALIPLRLGVIAPSVARTSPIKSVLTDVVGQGAIQATGGVKGAIAGAEAVGEEVSLGELVAEGLFEFSTAPIDLALSRGEITSARARQETIDVFANQFPPGSLTAEQKAQAEKIVDDAYVEGKDLSVIEEELKTFGLEIASNLTDPVVDEQTQEQVDVEEEVETVPAGTPRITPKEQKITLFDEQGQEVEGVVEKQNSAGAVQANVNGESVLVGDSRFSTVDPTAPNREFETLDETANVSELSDEELVSISETVETQVKNLGDAGSVLPTYNPLVRDLTSLRAEQERRGIRPIAKSAKPRIKVRGVIQNPTKQDIKKLIQGQQTEFDVGTPSILGPEKPKATEVAPEESALDTQVDNILEAIDKPASTVADIDTEFLDAMATELQYEDSMYDDLTGEERIDLFARALQVTQAPEMQGTATAQSATTILERAKPFQIKLAEEKLATLGAAPNEQLSYKAEPVASQGHTKKLGFGKLTEIPKREDLKSETDFMRSLDELMNAYAMGLERPEDLVPRIDALLARAKRLRNKEKNLRNTRQRQGGTRLIKTRLNEAVRRGELNPKTYDLFEWVINQNPELAAQVGISAIKRTDKIRESGSYTPYDKKISKDLEKLAEALDDPNYNPLMGVIRIIKDGPNSKPGTAVHELLHHLERMLPSDVQTSIREAWEKGLDAQIKISSQLETSLASILTMPSGLTNVELVAANPEIYKQLQEAKLRTLALVYLKQVNETKDSSRFENMYGAFDTRDDGLFDNLKKELGLPLDTIPLQSEDYQYFNPSEFWAVNATRILAGRYDIKDNVIKKIKNWVSEFITKLKGLVGIDPNSPVLKTLDDLIKGKISAEFKSEDMLMGNWDGNPGEAAKAQAKQFKSIINDNEKESRKGVSETRKLITKAVNTIGDVSQGVKKFTWLLAADTFTILDGLRKSKNTVLKNYAEALEDVIGNLRKDQQRLMKLGGDKLRKFSNFVAEAPVAGQLLMELMSNASAIRFNPAKYKTVEEAVEKDRGLAILRNIARKETLSELDLEDADYQLGIGWEQRDAKTEITTRIRAIRELMKQWQTLGRLKRAPTAIQKKMNPNPSKPYAGEAHDVYAEVKELYLNMLSEMETIRLANLEKTDLGKDSKDLIRALIVSQYKAIRRADPYFPLYRFGDFWVRVKGSSENYGVWTFDTAEERDAFEIDLDRDIRESGENPAEVKTTGDKRETLKVELQSDTLLQQAIDKLEAVKRARTQKDGDLKQPTQTEINNQIDGIKEEFIEMFLQTLPDRDLRTRMARRKATPGYSTDQVRALATYMGAAAAQLPRAKYKKDSELITQQARENIAGTPEARKLTTIIDELEGRVKVQFAPPEYGELFKASESLLSQTVFYKYLVAVDTALQNYSVLTTFAPALLGAEYGYATIGKLITKYITAVANPISQVDTKGVKLGSLEPGVADVENYSLFNTPLVQNNPILQAAYKYYNDQAGFNTNYISELTHFASQPSNVSLKDLDSPATTQQVLDAFSLIFRVTERQTREIVYLVAFEAEFNRSVKNIKQGDVKAIENAFKESTRAAKIKTQEVAFNYDPFNRNFNRWINSGGVGIQAFGSWATRQGARLGSFRFQAIALLLRNMVNAFSPLANVPFKERGRALKNLAGLTTFSLLTGGFGAASGSFVLLSALAMGIKVVALPQLFDDDIEEERQEKRRIENMMNHNGLSEYLYFEWIPNKFGGNDSFMTKVARGGVFNAVADYDFSSKLDYDFLAPNTYSRPASSVDAAIGDAATSMLGVTASDAQGIIETLGRVGKLLSQGRVGDAIYILTTDAITSQNQLRDVYRAYQDKTKGTSSERSLALKPEEISAFDTFMRGLFGVMPVDRANVEKQAGFKTRNRIELNALMGKAAKEVRDASEELTRLRRDKASRAYAIAEADLDFAINALAELELQYREEIEFGEMGKRGQEAVEDGRDKVNKALSKSGLSKAEAENIQRELLKRQSLLRIERRKREQQK
tara:strand:- start:7264 stop:14187 length:6924 start_codon:yes stop_codon:yes gene_type:complete